MREPCKILCLYINTFHVKYLGRINQGRDWSAWHCHIDQIWQLLLVVRSKGNPLKVSSQEHLALIFQLCPLKVHRTIKWRQQWFHFPEIKITRYVYNCSYRLKQHKNTLVYFFKLYKFRGKSLYCVPRDIVVYWWVSIAPGFLECDGDRRFRSPD